MWVKAKITTKLPESEFDKSLEQELQTYLLKLSELLNGGIKFEDNFNCQVKTVTDTGAADTEFSVAHTLKRTPVGFIIINNNKAGIVYDSGTAWSDTAIKLKCSVANCLIKIIIL